MDPLQHPYKELGISLALASACLLVFVIVFYFSQPFFIRPADALPAAVYPSTIVTLINSERLSHGLSVVSENALLDKAAQLKANDMVNNRYYAHVSPDGKTPLYWLNAVGYRYLNVGENLVVRVSNSNQAVDAWMNSPDHRDNILRADFTETGVAIAQGEYEGKETYYVVQLFAKPYPRPVSVPHIIPVPKKPAPAPEPVVAPMPKAISIPTSPSAKSSASSTVSVSASSTPERVSLAEQVKDLTGPILHAIASTTASASSISATSSSTPAPAVSIDTSHPVVLTSEGIASIGTRNEALIGKEELITRPETTPSETKNSLQLFVYFAEAKVADLLSN